MTKFTDILGNEQIKTHFQTAYESGNVSHAYIIDGPDGSGKRLFAESFAALLQCEGPISNEPCGQCHNCKQMEAVSHPDVIHVTHEKPATISVDDVRNQINADIATKPYQSRYKIYIVDEAEKMNEQAQNALLKTIEEPPEYGIIILLTTNANGFLPTILSRCIRLQLKPVAKDEIVKFLMKNHAVVDYKATEAACFAMGSVGKAVRLATSSHFSETRDHAVGIMKRISDIDITEAVAAVKKIADFKKEYQIDVYDYLDIMIMWYRDVLMYKATMDATDLIFKEEVYDIIRKADKSSYNGLQICIEELEKAKIRLDRNVNFDLTIELLLLKLKEN